MDLCMQGNFDKEIPTVRSNWKEFLTPAGRRTDSGPYPARFRDNDVPACLRRQREGQDRPVPPDQLCL